jgi:HK97 family phage major capsid protein
MSEQVQVKPVWEGYTRDQLRPWVVQAAQEAQSFYKEIQGKPDMPERIPFLETKYKEIEGATARLQQLDNAHLISERLATQMKSLNEPAAGQVPFENAGGSTTVSGAGQAQTKSLGEVFTDSAAYKSIGNHESSRVQYQVEAPDFTFGAGQKTVMTTSAGYAPPNPRTSVVVPAAQRDPRLADIIPSDPTNNTAIKYMVESTALAGTNAQVGTAENAAKWQNTLAYTETTANVGLIATWLPVTNQQLDDIPGMQALINNRMSLFLQLKEEDMLVTGTGVAPINITGFLAIAGTNTQALGADTNIDCIFRGIQKCRVTGFAEPDAIVMHPDNFTPIALYKSNTGEFGFNVTVDQSGVTRLFGKTLILTPAMTSGTALVGAFGSYSHISRKMGLTITVGLNSDDFTLNKKTILAEMRESLEIYRPSAFTKCTGLA